MTALDLLSRLMLDGVELHVQAGKLELYGHGPPPDDVTLVEVRAHKSELIALLDGTTCRWCRHPIDWKFSPAIALGDGTSLHGHCHEPFHVDRIMRNAARAVDPALADDPAEVGLHGDLPTIDQEAA
ncbi:MAG TPA: hypothetical protein VHL31_26420 [Geminicoccus sp.]|uniref:hypothetical protein n=1 Tax=Geminicoccus sp. TaxID=2024832 RepID=UPI002E35E7B1|nr:hypothetical protein [Geminicoccus sp.]HEX2529813.1 hypothetical protein [Geminicoccus sp.]